MMRCWRVEGVSNGEVIGSRQLAVGKRGCNRRRSSRLSLKLRLISKEMGSWCQTGIQYKQYPIVQIFVLLISKYCRC